MAVGIRRVVRFGLLIVVLALVSGCGMRRTPPPARSPNGLLDVVTSVNQDKTNPTRHLCVIVEICDRSGGVLHREVTPASDVMRWSVRWEDDNTVVLHSSDVGRYVIVKQNDGSWVGTLKP